MCATCRAATATEVRPSRQSRLHRAGVRGQRQGLREARRAHGAQSTINDHVQVEDMRGHAARPPPEKLTVASLLALACTVFSLSDRRPTSVAMPTLSSCTTDMPNAVLQPCVGRPTHRQVHTKGVGAQPVW